MPGDPAAFAEARLAEDEALARDAEGGEWIAKPVIYGPQGEGWGSPEDAPWEIYTASGAEVVSHVMHEGGGIDGGGSARHIARHDPARALREAEAGRRILARHAECTERGNGPCRQFPIADGLLCAELADLLTRWADHEDYDPEWRP